MSRFSTLRGRLTALALLAATLAVALVVVAFNVVLDRSLNGDINSRLRSHAAAASTTVSLQHGRIRVRESPDDEAIDTQVWVFQGRRAVLRPAAPPPVQRAAAALAGRSHAFQEVASDVRLYALPVTSGGRQVGTVVAGQSMATYDRTTDIALLASVGLAGLLLAAVYAVTWLAIGRALDPVTQMTRTVADWSEHDLDRRFGAEPRPGELGELAATFDGLLDRLAASLRHEQRLSAELSHELRTPLARITAEMELLARRERSAEDRAAAYEVVSRSAGQMNRILETLMAAARAQAAPQRGRSPLGASLERVAETWSAPLRQRGVRLEVQQAPEELVVGVDADVVERILAPLLDNAGRHARATVQIGGERRGGRVVVTVRDDGPGLPDAELDAIFEPGVRGLAATNGKAHAGAGLGLPLARRLARAVEGDVAARPSGGPGATFVVTLPV